MVATDAEIEALAAQVGQSLLAARARITTAESCTGGWIAKSLTDVAGSSAWFDYGFITYGNNAKQNMLNVDSELIGDHGAVSQEVAEQMAVGARRISGADLAVAVTGIAGPDGGTGEKPVGTVWLAWSGPGAEMASQMERFSGNRESVRRQTVVMALQGVLEELASS